MTIQQAQIEGGRRGGKARAAGMTAEERSESARLAALARSKSLSAKRRSEIARAGGKARWRYANASPSGRADRQTDPGGGR